MVDIPVRSNAREVGECIYCGSRNGPLCTEHAVPYGLNGSLSTISSRKLVLEVGKFNVLTAMSAEELFSTAEKFDVDAFVVDCPPGDALATEICESLKERHPRKPLFAVVAESAIDGHAPKCADYAIAGNNPQKLLAAVLEAFGPPRLE
jgi:DNA-binding NtrC family response regulator